MGGATAAPPGLSPTNTCVNRATTVSWLAVVNARTTAPGTARAITGAGGNVASNAAAKRSPTTAATSAGVGAVAGTRTTHAVVAQCRCQQSTHASPDRTCT